MSWAQENLLCCTVPSVSIEDSVHRTIFRTFSALRHLESIFLIRPAPLLSPIGACVVNLQAVGTKFKACIQPGTSLNIKKALVTNNDGGQDQKFQSIS